MRQYAIGHLLALDSREFFSLFGLRVEEAFAEPLRQMLELELAAWDENILRLTERGLLFRDLLARSLFSQRTEEREREYR